MTTGAPQRNKTDYLSSYLEVSVTVAAIIFALLGVPDIAEGFEPLAVVIFFLVGLLSIWTAITAVLGIAKTFQYERVLGMFYKDRRTTNLLIISLILLVCGYVFVGDDLLLVSLGKFLQSGSHTWENVGGFLIDLADTPAPTATPNPLP